LGSLRGAKFLSFLGNFEPRGVSFYLLRMRLQLRARLQLAYSLKFPFAIFVGLYFYEDTKFEPFYAQCLIVMRSYAFPRLASKIITKSLTDSKSILALKNEERAQYIFLTIYDICGIRSREKNQYMSEKRHIKK